MSHPFSCGISRQYCSSPFAFKTVKVARLMPGVRRKRTWIASRVQQRRLRGKKGSIANCSRMVDLPALSLGSRSKWNPHQDNRCLAVWISQKLNKILFEAKGNFAIWQSPNRLQTLLGKEEESSPSTTIWGGFRPFSMR